MHLHRLAAACGAVLLAACADLSTGPQTIERTGIAAPGAPVAGALAAALSSEIIVFSRNQQTTSGHDLFVIHPDGTGLRQLTTGIGNDFDPSTDGRRVVFGQSLELGGGLFNESIHVIDADGSNLTQLTSDGESFSPSLSRDGSRIVFVRGSFEDNAVYVMNSDGTGVMEVPNTGGVRNVSVVFSPDGTRIAIARAFGGGADLYLINIDGTGMIQLTDDEHLESSPSFSPDGTRLVFSVLSFDPAPDFDIGIIGSDGTGRVIVADGPAFDAYPAFSPEGDRIVFASNQTGTQSLWIMNDDGSGAVQLTEGPDHAPFWASEVLSPEQRIDAIEEVVAGLDLNGRPDIWRAQLARRLAAAGDDLANGPTRQGCAQLGAFVRQVSAAGEAGAIDDGDAGRIIAEADGIAAAVGC